MNNYFDFNDKQYISGWRYWLRIYLQGILIYAFGLGLYLIAVTTYKRSLSLGDDKTTATAYAVYNALLGPIFMFAAAFNLPEPGAFFFACLVLNIPHLRLWFAEGKLATEQIN